jgi:adenylate cyclase
VLFAEVAATPAGLAGTLGLEELRDQVGGSLATVIAEVEAMGGTVSSVSGRGLQAMFGAPEAHEDDPERALHAAYRALAVLGAAHGRGNAAPGGPASRPGLRIGVESGPALVALIGGGARVEYTALGDVVSVAAALQSAARPGSVLVGPATHAATAHLFSWGEREDVAPAPGARALSASYLAAPRVTAAERRPRLGGRAPLVGRQPEQRMLDAAVRAAVDGRGQAIVLTGEPGIGKTRLVQETRNRFIAWVGAGSTRRPLWLEGRGTSYTSSVPYGLYRQMIAGWIGVGTDQPADVVRAALGRALTRLLGNSNLLDPLAHLMGAGIPDPDASRPSGPAHRKISPGEQQRQAFAAVRALVTRFTAMSPTVLVLEDLHWADPTSRRLTAELAELTESRPLLLLATARPGPGQAPALALAGPSRELRLRPLADAAARSLASALLGQVDQPEVLATALTGADGNPLFLEERLAEMLETGMLTRDSGQWRLRDAVPGPTGTVPLPQVLERLVRSRVDRLSPAAAEAIRAASVLGTEFTADVLAGMLAMPVAALAPLLDELCDSDLVHHGQPDRARSPFRFRHALIQEATYLALLRSERRDLHGRAARALEAAYDRPPGEIAAVLGRHFAIAGAVEQAVRYLELAGDDATDAFANDEAIASFREALTVMSPATDPAGAIRLNAKLANVLWRTAQRDAARDAFQAALRVAAGPHPVDPVLRAHLYTRLGRLELSALRFTEAAAALDAAHALLALDAAQVIDPEQVDDATADQWLELTVDGRAELHAMRFEPDRALAVLDRAAPVLAARGGPARKTPFYRLCTTQKMLRNRLRVDQDDIASLRASAAEAEHTGEDKDVGYAQFFLGWVLWLRGDLDAADRELDQALTLANRIGETHLRDLALLTRCMTALRRHDAEMVRTLLPQAFAARDNGGYPEGRLAGRLACAAWLAWQDNRPEEVIRVAGQIEGFDPSTLGSETKYRWIYLFPVIAARLRSGDIGPAATAAAQITAPGPW